MKLRIERRWLVVAILFLTLLVVFGAGYDAAGVFFTPMRKDLGWSRARLSSLQTALALTAGLCAPLVGWLIDRIGARAVMSAGVSSAGIAFLLISRAHRFELMFAAYVLLGIGIGAATILPCSVVVANWFGERRGTALGITMSGTSVGGMVMTLVAARIIAAAGWRECFAVFALPVFVVLLPMVIAAVRTRPAQPDSLGPTAEVEGLEMHEAVRAAAFWMIALAQFCYSFAAAAATVHTVPYLLEMGYRPERAAQMMSVIFGLASIGKPMVGYMADYLGGRAALAICLLVAAFGQALLLDGRSIPMLIAYIVMYGPTSGAPLALVPMVIAESLGLRRFGSVAGVTGIAMTLGAASGPILAGWIVDRGFGYAAAFGLFAAALAFGAVAASRCMPLGATRS